MDHQAPRPPDRASHEQRLADLLQGRSEPAAVIAWLLIAADDCRQPSGGERYSFILSLLNYVRDQTRGISGSPSKPTPGSAALDRTASFGAPLLSPAGVGVGGLSRSVELGSPTDLAGSGMLCLERKVLFSEGADGWAPSPAVRSPAKKAAPGAGAKPRGPSRRLAPTRMAPNPVTNASGNIGVPSRLAPSMAGGTSGNIGASVFGASGGVAAAAAGPAASAMAWPALERRMSSRPAEQAKPQGKPPMQPQAFAVPAQRRKAKKASAPAGQGAATESRSEPAHASWGEESHRKKPPRSALCKAIWWKVFAGTDRPVHRRGSSGLASQLDRAMVAPPIAQPVAQPKAQPIAIPAVRRTRPAVPVLNFAMSALQTANPRKPTQTHIDARLPCVVLCSLSPEATWHTHTVRGWGSGRVFSGPDAEHQDDDLQDELELELGRSRPLVSQSAQPAP